MVQGPKECHNEDDASPLCMEKEVAARTHFYPYYASERPDHGLVEEADVELNAVAYDWVIDGGGPGKANLRRTIHHELGHVLGLDHPCEEGAAAASGRESPIPRCSEVDDAGLLMHPAAAVTYRSVSLKPSAADIAELCRQYGAKPWWARQLREGSLLWLGLASLAVGMIVFAFRVCAGHRSRPPW